MILDGEIVKTEHLAFLMKLRHVCPIQFRSDGQLVPFIRVLVSSEAQFYDNTITACLPQHCGGV